MQKKNSILEIENLFNSILDKIKTSGYTTKAEGYTNIACECVGSLLC